jgi:hypothetical protein
VGTIGLGGGILATISAASAANGVSTLEKVEQACCPFLQNQTTADCIQLINSTGLAKYTLKDLCDSDLDGFINTQNFGEFFFSTIAVGGFAIALATGISWWCGYGTKISQYCARREYVPLRSDTEKNQEAL